MFSLIKKPRYFELTCVSNFICRTWSLPFDDPHVYRFWPARSVGCQMDSGMWLESRYWDKIKTHAIVDTPANCWFIYKVHSLRHDSYDRDLVIIFAANHCVSGQMVKSISWQQPGTLSQWEGFNFKGWPMRGSWQVLTRDMDTSRVMEVFWPEAWCIQCVWWQFPGFWLGHFDNQGSWLAAQRDVFIKLLSPASRALWSHKASQGDCQ